MIKKACFIGCSFTIGDGFPIESRNNYIYDHLVSRRFGLDHINISECGASNYKIFMRSADILKKDFDIIFVQWSALNRLWLHPGPDSQWFVNDGNEEFYCREIHLNKKFKKTFESTLRLMNHDYHNIFQLIDYCSILDRLANYHGKMIVYINGLVPWTKDLDQTITPNFKETLSQYTKELLDFDNRPDYEIKMLFDSLQEKFSELDQSKWVNLFDSFQSSIVDYGPLGHHPGIQSHKNMADKIINYLAEKRSIDQ